MLLYKHTFILIFLFSIILFSNCEKKEEKLSLNEFQSNWSNEPDIKRLWAGPEYWLNPLQAWEQKDGKLNVVSSGGDRNCVLLTRELNKDGDYFEMEVSIEDVNDNDTSGWAGFQIGLQGQFNDYRDDAVHGRGFCVGVTNDGHLFIGNKKEKIPDKEHVPNYNIKLTGRCIGDSSCSLTLIYKNQYAEQTINSIIDKSWLVGLISFTSSEYLPDNVQVESKKPAFKNIPNLKKGTGGNTFHSFSNWKIFGNKITSYPDRAFGPIMWCQHTLSNNILKLSAQLAPMGNDKNKIELWIDGKKNQETKIDPTGYNGIFMIEDWDSNKDHNYEVVYISKNGKKHSYKGIIKKDPQKNKIKVASLSCVDDVGFPHQDIVKNVLDHEPDIFVFHGDQLYERVGGYGVERSSVLDYLKKWYIWGWSFGDFTRNTPTIIIPDDHDVFHGNLWGEAGKRADISKGWGYDSQDDGGYKELPEFVNMVHHTQTGHLPTPYDPTPVLNNISVYYTNMNYGGISFAILGDRQWKSAPQKLLPDAEIENGWPQNKKWDAKTQAYHPDAELLGERQELFLEKWAADWSEGIYFKAVISQSPFCNVATLPKDIYHDKYVPGLPRYRKGGYPPDDRPVADFDSNGWPQNKRDKAIASMRKAFAIHLTGDQHLGSTGQYGIDGYGDANYWVSTPAVSNLWPRRWFPAEKAKTGRTETDPIYTGNFEDGFGNKISVKAIANPYDIERSPEKIFDKAPGYSIIVFDKKTRNIEVSVWPRWASPKNNEGENKPFEGWPIHVSQENNYGKNVAGYLPEINIEAGEYIQLINEGSNELIYAIRPPVGKFSAKVFDKNISYKLIKLKNGENLQELVGLKIN